MAEVGRNLEVAPKSLKTWIVLHQQGTLTGSLGVAKLSVDLGLTAHTRFRQSDLPRVLRLAFIVSNDYLKPRLFVACTSASVESLPMLNTSCPLRLTCSIVNLI